MSLDAAIRLLDRVEHGAKEPRELYGVCGKAAVLDDAESLGWVTVGDVIAITDKGRRALDGARSASAPTITIKVTVVTRRIDSEAPGLRFRAAAGTGTGEAWATTQVICAVAAVDALRRREQPSPSW